MRSSMKTKLSAKLELFYFFHTGDLCIWVLSVVFSVVRSEWDSMEKDDVMDLS